MILKINYFQILDHCRGFLFLIPARLILPFENRLRFTIFGASEI